MDRRTARTWRSTALALMVLLALFAAGCGSDDDDAGDTAPVVLGPDEDHAELEALALDIGTAVAGVAARGGHQYQRRNHRKPLDT